MNGPSLDRLQEIAGQVSRETFEALVEFEQVFQKWARRINLSSPSTLNEVWNRHILDSAQLLRIETSAKIGSILAPAGVFRGW